MKPQNNLYYWIKPYPQFDWEIGRCKIERGKAFFYATDYAHYEFDEAFVWDPVPIIRKV